MSADIHAEAARGARHFLGHSALLIAAHPDDEVLFAASQLRSFKPLMIVHVTDGAESMTEARTKGFRTRRAYSKARFRELHAALGVAGIAPMTSCLSYRDGSSCLHLLDLVKSLSHLIAATNAEIILTHAYEGGHQDHDTVAVAVQMACALCPSPPPVWEMACYHEKNGRFISHRFPEAVTMNTITIALTPAQQELKNKMLHCFESQMDFVHTFRTDQEEFRLAPTYHFDHSPVDGRLAYDANDYCYDSALWRLLVRTNQKVLSRSLSYWRLRFLNLAMYLMIKSFRMRKLYPNITRPFEGAMFKACCFIGKS